MKRLFYLIIPFMFITISCEDSVVEPRIYSVGMISGTGGWDDMSYNYTCRQGLERAEEKLRVVATYKEANDETQFVGLIEELIEENSEFIFNIGYEQRDALIESAERYKATRFVAVDFAINAEMDNVYELIFDVRGAAFMCGFIAAYFAEYVDDDDPAVGYIGAYEVDEIKQFTVSYAKGVEYYNTKFNKKVKVFGVFAGTYKDDQLVSEKTTKLITENGLDVIFPVVGKTAHAALLAAQEEDVLGIGVDSDQYLLLEDVNGILITSCIKHLDQLIFEFVDDYTNARFTNTNRLIGRYSNEAVGIAPFHEYRNWVSSAFEKEIDRLDSLLKVNVIALE